MSFLFLVFYHFVEFYLAVDDFCYDYLHENFQHVKCFKLIKTENADHVSQSPQQQEDFIEIIKAKFTVAKEAFKDSNFIFWCDVDHIFFNPIEKRILELIDTKAIDAAVTPHHSDGFADEKTVGYYNCGFVLISNPDLSPEMRSQGLKGIEAYEKGVKDILPLNANQDAAEGSKLSVGSVYYDPTNLYGGMYVAVSNNKNDPDGQIQGFDDVEEARAHARE